MSERRTYHSCRMRLHTHTYTYTHCRFVREMKISESGDLTEQHMELVNRLYQRIMEVNKRIRDEEMARPAAEG